MKKSILLTAIVLLVLLSVFSVFAQEDTAITLLHYSDYHSHAVIGLSPLL